MAEHSLSQIVSLIMENPDLVEKIRSIAAQSIDPQSESEEVTVEKTVSEAVAEETSPPRAETEKEPERQGASHKRRTELMRAIKPYLSPKRQNAIETMITVAQLIDITQGG